MEVLSHQPELAGHWANDIPIQDLFTGVCQTLCFHKICKILNERLFLELIVKLFL